MEWWLIPLILLAVIGAGWLGMMLMFWVFVASYFSAEKRSRLDRKIE
jgi:hypothetical protein